MATYRKVAEVNAPEPYRGKQRVRIIWEFNGGEYNSDCTIELPEPLVQIIVEELVNDEEDKPYWRRTDEQA